RHRDARGETIVDDSFLLLLHSGDLDGAFTLPDEPWAAGYERVVDTAALGGFPVAKFGAGIPGAVPLLAAGSDLALPARSVLLRRVGRSEGGEAAPPRVGHESASGP